MGMQTSTRRTRILIVDDHPIVRRGLTALIEEEPDLEVCGEADTAGEAIKKVRQCNPELVIVDISLKKGNGIDLIKQIKTYQEDMRMLVASMFDESLYGERALRAGAMGYVNKEQLTENLVEAIRRVLSGEIYVSPAMAGRMLNRMVGRKDEDQRSPIERLTDRELEVFRMIGQGLTTREIASKLHLSPKTVEGYREKLKTKLSLRNGTELSRMAMQWTIENG
ncbi:Transcriptional regulatory protein DegU [Planctomycetales bacterium 10988]|nr:Transcriptional regulatory protein DegU [Planctomycetales bacterium 10988]